MAIEDRAADASVEDVRKCEVVSLRTPAAYASVIALREALDMKALRIGRAAAKADRMRSVDLLQAARLGR